MSVRDQPCVMNIYLCGSTRANAATSPPLVYHSEQHGTLVSVSPVFRWRRKRPTRPSHPRVFPQPPQRWGYWAGERACIDFDLNWATFMVNFTRAASSAHQFTPSHLAEGKWDSFFTGGSTAAWGPHTRPLAQSDGKWWGLCMRVECETVDTIARCFSVLGIVVLGSIHKSNAASD